MDKKTFDVIMNYTNLVRDLYPALEEKLGTEAADKLVVPFDEYHARELKLGVYQDVANLVNRSGHITEDYEELIAYTKVDIHYSYDTGYSLCETTDGELYLIPNKIISPNIDKKE